MSDLNINDYGDDIAKNANECGYRMGSDDRSFSLNLADRQWWCPNCHRLHIRDWNAAKNILTKGLKYYNQQPLHVTNVYQQ